MLIKTHYTVTPNMLQTAVNNLPSPDFRFAINKPTGNFFYDPWVLKDELKNTIWKDIYETLPLVVGEARIINLLPGTCYHSHADIDDRYHLTLSSEKAYLVDLEHGHMHRLQTDGIWYEMDTGKLHSAVNFGRTVRTQLVVRKLLKAGFISNPISVKISTAGFTKDHGRFVFDDILSPWLNWANKTNSLTNFTFEHGEEATFKMDRSLLSDLQSKLVNGLTLEIL